MSFPIEKYKFIKTPRQIIAISTYAGRRVRGVATCHENDLFDEELGKALAASRCALKIAKKRAKRASEALLNAEVAKATALKQYARMTDYYTDSMEALNEIETDLENLLNTLRKSS